MTALGWIVEDGGYDPAREGLFGSLFFQGNGRFGFRGKRDDANAGDPRLASTFAAGFFGELADGRTDMVNCPDVLHASLSVEGRPAAAGGKRRLDLRTGELSWDAAVDVPGGSLEIGTRRFPSLADRRLAVQRWTFAARGRDVRVELALGIDGGTLNRPVHDDQLKANAELANLRSTTRKEAAEGQLRFGASAAGTGIALEIAAEVRVSCGGAAAAADAVEGDRVLRRLSFVAPAGATVFVDRFVALATSRDPFGARVLARAADPADRESFAASASEAEALGRAVASAAREAAEAGFEAAFAAQEAAWRSVWDACAIDVPGDPRLALGLRFSEFNLIQSCAEDDPGVSVGARGLSHGRYKGCFFWDTDVFMLPFFALSRPAAARSLLEYRAATLPGARANARAQGLRGARYSWMCTLDGREQCDTWDIGLSEVHITADVAWAVLRCREWLGDGPWFAGEGREILAETARYWASRFTRRPGAAGGAARWDLLWVKGPDEYGGVSVNNVFTVALARENLRAAADAVEAAEAAAAAGDDASKDLLARLALDSAETALWREIAGGCVLPYDAERGLYLEDELFMRKEPVDLASLKEGDAPLYRKIPFDRLQRLRVVKQADLVLLGLLLPDFYAPGEARAAWDFYEPLTAHDSTLSFGSHAEAAARLGLAEAGARYLRKAALLDLDDLMGNAADEGLHLAAMGGAWRALAFGFAGLSFDASGRPSLDPVALPGAGGYSFRFVSRGVRYEAAVSDDGWILRDASGNEAGRGTLAGKGDRP